MAGLLENNQKPELLLGYDLKFHFDFIAEFITDSDQKKNQSLSNLMNQLDLNAQNLNRQNNLLNNQEEFKFEEEEEMNFFEMVAKESLKPRVIPKKNMMQENHQILQEKLQMIDNNQEESQNDISLDDDKIYVNPQDRNYDAFVEKELDSIEEQMAESDSITPGRSNFSNQEKRRLHDLTLRTYKVRFLVTGKKPKNQMIDLIINYLILKRLDSIKLATLENFAHEYLEEIAQEITNIRYPGVLTYLSNFEMVEDLRVKIFIIEHINQPQKSQSMMNQSSIQKPYSYGNHQLENGIQQNTSINYLKNPIKGAFSSKTNYKRHSKDTWLTQDVSKEDLQNVLLEYIRGGISECRILMVNQMKIKIFLNVIKELKKIFPQKDFLHQKNTEIQMKGPSHQRNEVTVTILTLQLQ